MTLLGRQTFRIVETVFLKLLAVVYFAAFASLWPQMPGLVGAHGITPAVETMSAMRAEYGWQAWFYVPSLFWLNQSDWVLQAICIAGCAAAFLLLFGVLVRTSAVAAYVLYLSLVSIGQPFTSFQWDALLLETGFLAMFAGAPLLPIAYRFLLFRLMFESGLVKLTSHDPNWSSLHALRYHFYTQPLPSPLAFYFQYAPDWLLSSLTLATLLIELIVPFFVFAPWKLVRQIAVGLLVLLQLAIALTGNYAFFNLLSIALCLWGLDDECFRRLPTSVRPSRLSPRFTLLLNAVVAAVMLMAAAQIFGLRVSLTDSFEIVNPYGLFAVMTTSRIELVVEGSNDRVNWKSYELPYKPGDVRRSLPLVAPHQPRLDWQMWFAALGEPQANPWMRNLVYRLLTGQPEVLKLLSCNPFPQPPSAIRVQAYVYNFASPQERKRDGTVWRRTFLGTWLGPVQLN